MIWGVVSAAIMRTPGRGLCQRLHDRLTAFSQNVRITRKYPRLPDRRGHCSASLAGECRARNADHLDHVSFPKLIALGVMTERLSGGGVGFYTILGAVDANDRVGSGLSLLSIAPRVRTRSLKGYSARLMS